MKGGTLFSGIGAPECAAPGIDWRWCAEIEPFASAVHRGRFPGVPNLGDVTEVDPDAVEPVDLMVFGSPCQSFSVAGRRLGLDDPRGNLALVALRLVARLRPRWFLFENVPGLLSSGEGRDFGAFLGAVGECGYGWAYRVLDAQYFGVPQRRRRLFVVGHLGDWRAAAAVLFEPESLRGDPAPCRPAGEGVAHDLAPCIGASGRGFERTGDPRGQDAVIAHALRAEGFDASEDGTGRGTPLVTHALTAPTGRGTVTEDGTGRGTPLVPVAFDPGVITNPMDYSNPQPGGPCHAIQARSHTPTIAFHARQDPDSGPVTHRLDTDGCLIAVAFRTNQTGAQGPIWSDDLTDSLAQDHPPAIASPMSVRRLTPTECERLQGFPDGWTAITWRGKPAADGPRYRALGNAMCVPVIKWILDRIADAAG